jgi:hypothetical protein
MDDVVAGREVGEQVGAVGSRRSQGTALLDETEDFGIGEEEDGGVGFPTAG